MELGKDYNDHIITKEEFKTLNTENISQIILKNGEVLKFNNDNNNNNLISLNTTNLKACTCHKKNSNRNIIRRYKINNNKEVYVTPIPNASSKLLAIKVPYCQEQKDIKYIIKTFTFETSPRKYKYKPYKTPKRRHTSRNKSTGYKYINNKQCTCNQRNNKNKQCICMQYCTCRKLKKD